MCLLRPVPIHPVKLLQTLRAALGVEPYTMCAASGTVTSSQMKLIQGTLTQISQSMSNDDNMIIATVSSKLEQSECLDTEQKRAEAISGLSASHKNSNLNSGIVSSLNRLERKSYLANTNYQYRKWLEEHPEMQKKLFRKMLQKQRIKREYIIAYRAGKIQKETKTTTLKMADVSTKVARKVQEMITRNSTLIVSALLLLILLPVALT